LAEIIRQKDLKIKRMITNSDRESWIDDEYFKYFSYDYQAQLKMAR